MADNLKDTLHREQDKNGDTKYVAGVDPDTGDPIYADTLWEAQNKKINNEMSTFKDRWKDSVSSVFKKQEGFALDKEFWTDGWTENKFYTKEGQGELWYDGAVPSFVKSMADSTFFKNLKWDGGWSKFWESFGDSWKKPWAEFGKTAEDYWNKENAEAMQAAVNQSKPWLEMYPSAMQQRMKTLATYGLAETDTKIKSVTKDTNNWRDVWSEFNQTNWVHGILNFKESTGMSGAEAISFLTDTKPFESTMAGLIPKKLAEMDNSDEKPWYFEEFHPPLPANGDGSEYHLTVPNVSYWYLIGDDYTSARKDAEDAFFSDVEDFDYAAFIEGLGTAIKNASTESEVKDNLKSTRKTQYDLSGDYDASQVRTKIDNESGRGDKASESHFKKDFITDIPDRESEEASEDIDSKIKDDTSQLPRYSTIIPNDMSDLVRLRNACFSNNYNTMILIHNRSEETATINGMLTTLKDSHGKMDPNALLIDLIDKSESFATDGEANDINDILAHTFMYRSKGITIPEVKSASATIESYGISSDHVFYGVPSYSNKGKISFIMDRELALFAALGALSGMPHATKTDSGVDSNHSTMLLNNLRSERFYKNYEVTIISGFFGMNAMSHEAYEYIQRTNDGVKVLTDEEMYTLMNGNIKKNNKGAQTLSATNIHSGSSLMFVLSDVRMLGSGSSISLKQGNASQVEVPYDFTFKEMVALRANYL